MKFFVILWVTLFWVVGCQTETTENPNKSSVPGACTKDAKVCEDGQTVSRNPALNCAFDPCPEPLTEIQCADDMKQCPDGSFVKRHPNNECLFKACPEQSKQKEPVVYCTQEALQCDDGSYVGRDPENNCAFKPCPDGSEPERSKPRLD
ncbi:hypothetical protein GCM10011365_21250 [Marinicella pacifica]|uniref:Uncharacterized protein n=1 Tax=Marinicella pacifica TaxID=1171543 RepID=A0A917CUW9_9GAMM|nr:hypothetical protein [Marinicella pacifica]GGF99756.1 hypothetical protein GCM10011365_21250 [Marinicella pacifica]